MTNQALVGLAILKANWDERGASYLRSFVPFVAECLRQAPQREVSLEDVSDCLVKEFGLSIPHGVVHSILKRAARDGLLKAERGVFVRKDRALQQEYDLGPRRAEALRQLNLLTVKLSEFAGLEFGRQLNESEAQESLLQYVEQRPSRFCGLRLQVSQPSSSLKKLPEMPS